MIRFIMRWTLSLGAIDGGGPPGNGCNGVNRAHSGTSTRFAARLNSHVSGNPFTNRLNQPCWLSIRLAPRKRTAAAHFTRDFIGVLAGLKDRIAGGFDARSETAGVETDVFAIRGLILGQFDQREGTHDDSGPPRR